MEAEFIIANPSYRSTPPIWRKLVTMHPNIASTKNSTIESTRLQLRAIAH
jgi:hypothetical protein